MLVTSCASRASTGGLAGTCSSMACGCRMTPACPGDRCSSPTSPPTRGSAVLALLTSHHSDDTTISTTSSHELSRQSRLSVCLAVPLPLFCLIA